MTALLRTRRLARPLSLLTTAALLGYPAAMLLMALSGYFDDAFLRETYGSLTLPAQIALPVWIALYTTALISIALVTLALWNMRALLSLYAMGDVLGAEAASRIRRIGHCLLALAVWGVLSHTLDVAALTWNNPPGMRSLSVAFSNSDLFLFLAAGLMSVIGWAMSEAARVADENRSFV